MTYTFAIYNEAEERIFTAQHATSEPEALDEYAAFRSGYDTFTEMSRSRVFRDIGACEVHVQITAA